MRINLTKKDLVNIVYMQVGFSKQISESLIDEFFSLIIMNLKKEKKLKISKFGTFTIREKNMTRSQFLQLIKEKLLIKKITIFCFYIIFCF